MLAITSLMVIVCSAVLNLVIDPFDLYGLGLFPRTVMNHYQIKLGLIQEFDPPPEALILGSSRAYALDPDVVEGTLGQRCFNFSVPSAKAETYYSILRLMLEEFDAPIDTIILAVDPETFHPTLPIQSEARYIEEYARYFVYNDAAQATVWDRIALLPTLDQTTESFGSIHKLFQKSTGVKWMDYRDDGYSTFTQREQEISEGTFDLQSRLDNRIGKYPERSLRLSDFTGLCEVRQRYWEDFIELCRENDITVYAFMPVEHPQLHEFMLELGADEIFNSVSEYLGGTLAYEGWVYRDFTDIEEFDGDPDEFYDEIHLRPDNADRVLQSLMSSEE